MGSPSSCRNRRYPMAGKSARSRSFTMAPAFTSNITRGEWAVSSPSPPSTIRSSSPSASILIKSIDGHPRTALSKSRLVTRTGSPASAVESARNSLDVANARFPSLSPSERAAPTISRLGRDRRQCGWDRNGQIAKTQPEIERLACFSRFGRTHTTAFGRNFRCPLGYRAASIV